MELNIFPKYIFDRAASELWDGNTRQFYYCYHLYSYQKQGNNIRGINNINKTCTYSNDENQNFQIS